MARVALSAGDHWRPGTSLAAAATAQARDLTVSAGRRAGVRPWMFVVAVLGFLVLLLIGAATELNRTAPSSRSATPVVDVTPEPPALVDTQSTVITKSEAPTTITSTPNATAAASMTPTLDELRRIATTAGDRATTQAVDESREIARRLQSAQARIDVSTGRGEQLRAALQNYEALAIRLSGTIERPDAKVAAAGISIDLERLDAKWLTVIEEIAAAGV